MKKVVVSLFALSMAVSSLFAEFDKETLFGKEVYDEKGEPIKAETLSADIYGIYFSAHWCPPCRAFSPTLVRAYKKINRREKVFEVIFVSSDKTPAVQFDYMEEMDMPWYAVKHGSKEVAALKKKYKVSGIPKLVIIDSNGELVTDNGRSDIQSRGMNAYKDWVKDK